MVAAYSFIVRSYQLAIRFAALVHPKAKLWVNGRKNWKQNLTRKINQENDWIWIHCSSLGEFEDSAEVVRGIRQSHPYSSVLLTFFSPTGMQATIGEDLVDHKVYLPIDSRRNASAFLDLVQPKMILFSRSDLWYHYLSEISKRAIPTFLISALVNPSSTFFKWPQKKIYRKCYAALSITCHRDKK